MSRKGISSDFIFVVTTNLIAAMLLSLITAGVDQFLKLNINPYSLMTSVIILSSSITLLIFLKSYNSFVNRFLYLKLLKENSATKSFALFIDIAKRLFTELTKEGSVDDKRKAIEDILLELDNLVDLRRQPMEIAASDIKKLVREAYSRDPDAPILTDQIICYLDFVSNYRKLANYRIRRQVANYINTFLNTSDDYHDYVLVYGHSTNVVEAITESFKMRKFTIIIIEDLQYHEQSLSEHQLVFRKFLENSTEAFVLKFGQIKDLFDKSVNQIEDVNGRQLALLRGRRLHAFLGCERIDTNGNALIPAKLKGIPSESALFLQEVDAFAKEFADIGMLARVIMVAESYKIRDYDRNTAAKTHAPHRQNFLQDTLFLLGLNNMPPMQEVSLFEVSAHQIYIHINELGIFPNVNGKFNLNYCTDVFFSEANLLGAFSELPFLNYAMIDNVEAILFDFNGVIINDEHLQYEAFRQALEIIEIKLTSHDYKRLCSGFSDYNGFSNISEEFGLSWDTKDIDNITAKKTEIYLNLLQQRDDLLSPGAKTFLDLLKRYGYATALVTASTRQEIESALSILDIKKHFDIIITNDDVNESKPSPQGYLLAISSLGVHKSRCLAIEDNRENISQLNKAGIKTAAIANGATTNDFDAMYVLNSLEEFLVYL